MKSEKMGEKNSDYSYEQLEIVDMIVGGGKNLESNY